VGVVRKNSDSGAKMVLRGCQGKSSQEHKNMKPDRSRAIKRGRFNIMADTKANKAKRLDFGITPAYTYNLQWPGHCAT
jgi:Fe-S cluster assembly scaffold protein SufB